MAEWNSGGEALLTQGNASWDKGDRLQAEKIFRQLVQEYPERPEGYNKVGMVMAESGHLEDAEQYFLRSLAQDRTYAPALTNLGNVYLERGQLDQAIQHYLLALQNDRDYPAAHRNLGVAYKRQGKYSAYVSHFKRSQRLDNRQARESLRRSRGSGGGKAPRLRVQLPSFVWLVLLLIGVAIIVSEFHR